MAASLRVSGGVRKRPAFALAVALLFSAHPSRPVVAAECAFVASGGIDAITVLDVATERVTGHLPTGLVPVATALDVGGHVLWVANMDDHTVSAIDLGSGRVQATVRVGFFPTDVQAHPNGEHIYVADRRSDRLSVIDVTTYTVVDAIPTQGSGPSDIEITRDGTRAYVANSFSNRVTAVDLVTGNAIGGVQVGELPFDIALSPDETHVYAGNVESGTVSVVRVADLTVVETIPVGGNPLAVEVMRDGTSVYAVNSPLGEISVIDTATNVVTTTISLSQPGFTPELAGIDLNADGTIAFVADFLFANLYAIDTSTHQVISFTATSGSMSGPQGVTVAEVDGRCPSSPAPLLTADVGASDVVVPLERADLLPAAGTLRVDEELLTYYRHDMRVAVMNVERGVEGTAATSHATGTPAFLVGQAGDANCDGTIGAADLTSLITRLPSASPGACGADIERDGTVTAADLPALIAALFDPPF